MTIKSLASQETSRPDRATQERAEEGTTHTDTDFGYLPESPKRQEYRKVSIFLFLIFRFSSNRSTWSAKNPNYPRSVQSELSIQIL